MANTINTTDTIETFRLNFNALNGQVNVAEGEIDTLQTDLAANSTHLNTVASDLASNSTHLNTVASDLAANVVVLTDTVADVDSLIINVAANSATLTSAVANIASINTAITSINASISNIDAFTNNLSAGFSDGSAANAGIRFASNNNTGLFKTETNTIAVTAGGVERARFKTTGEIIIGGNTAGANASGSAITLALPVHAGSSITANGAVTFTGSIKAPAAAGVANVITNTAASNTITLGSTHANVKIMTGGIDRFTIDTNGNIITGSATVFTKFNVDGGLTANSVSVGSGLGAGHGILFNAKHDGTNYIAKTNSNAWAVESTGNTLNVSLLTGQTGVNTAYTTSTTIISANASTVGLSKNAAVTGTLTTSGNTSVGGNLNVTGDLTVAGTTTYINTNTLNIGDNIITLNADYAGSSPTENAGFEINRGSLAAVTLRWNETSDRWEITNDGTTYAQIISANSVGAGGGLDADLLDGQHGSYYRDAGNLNAGIIPSTRLSGTYSISVTGNANTVTNLNSGQIVTALTYTPMDSAKDVGVGTGLTKTGTLNGGNLSLAVNTTYTDSRYAALAGGATFTSGTLETAVTDVSLVVNARLFQNAYGKDGVTYGTGSYSSWYNATTRTISYDAKNAFNGGTTIGSATIALPSSGTVTMWHSGNDGAGSGLDADLLDGQDSSYYTNITARLGYTPYYGGSSGVNFTASDVTITKAQPTLILNKTTATQSSQIQGTKNNSSRWLLRLGNDEAESGSNAGSNFDLFSYDDSGNIIGSVLYINRTSKAATFYGTLTNTNTHTINGTTNSNLILNKAIGSYGNIIWGQKNFINYWNIELGNSSADNFVINRLNDSGVYQETPFYINRSGDAYLKNATFYNTGTIKLANTRINVDGNLEVNVYGTGDRQSFIDFHSSGTPDANDFSARLIRNSGVNGSFDIVDTGSDINIKPAYGSVVQLGADSNNNRVLIRRQGGDEGGHLELEAPATNTSLTSSIFMDSYQDMLRLFAYTSGSVYRGIHINLASLTAGSWEIIHAGNFNSFLIGSDTQDVGHYVFAAPNSTKTPGQTESGGNLTWGSHVGARSGTLSGTWRCCGYAFTNEATVWQRIS